MTASDFKLIMATVKNHVLSDFVRNNLAAVAGGYAKSQVSFPYYTAFNSLLSKIEIFKKIYLTTTRGNFKHEMTKEQFLHASQAYGQITPLEVSILFQLADLNHPGKGLLNFEDLELIDPERLKVCVKHNFRLYESNLN